MTAKIKSISVSGVRTLHDFTLKLDGLTVLIGENGSGKSTVVETFELLHRLPNQNFWNEFNQIHGGESSLLRLGAGEIKLGVVVADDTWTATYNISFGRSGITAETLEYTPCDDPTSKINVIERIGDKLRVRSTSPSSKNPVCSPVRGRYRNQPSIGLFGIPGNRHSQRFLSEFSEVLQDIDVQVPFATTATWLNQSQGIRHGYGMRNSETIAPASKLERFGSNLANAFHTLKNEQSPTEWDYTKELVRLGLGQWVDSVNLRADPGGGKIALWIKIANTDKQIPSASLSDGQLSYLAFVALARLHTKRSILVFDEIETHLHPRLLSRVLQLIRMIADKCPVLLTTHSRRVLDDLDEPAKAVAVLELDQESMTTKLRRLDEAKLTDWLEDYEGLGHVLDAGYPETLFQVEADVQN